MIKSYEIKGAYYKNNCFASMNDYITQYRYNKYSANNFKKKFQNIVIDIIKQKKLKRINKPITLLFEFGETSKKRDYDNIASFGIKVILDALQECNIIPNDNQKWVKGWECKFYESKEPYIKFTINELEE